MFKTRCAGTSAVRGLLISMELLDANVTLIRNALNAQESLMPDTSCIPPGYLSLW